MKTIFSILFSIYAVSLTAQVRTVSPCNVTVDKVPSDYVKYTYKPEQGDVSINFYKVDNSVIVALKSKGGHGKIFKVVKKLNSLELHSVEDSQKGNMYFNLNNGVIRLCVNFGKGDEYFSFYQQL